MRSAMTDLDKYDYQLPKERIAQQPLSVRTDSRLMVVNRADQTIEHFHFRDLPSLLNAGDALVINDTRVLPAKLVGYRQSTGGRWQGLFLEKDENEVWKILCKTRGKLMAGEQIGLVDRTGRAAAELVLIARLDEGMWAARTLPPQPTFPLLQRIGRVPLPHYIRQGESLSTDFDTYQTVFAREAGSVAAPTAGLHFTDDLFQRLTDQHISIVHATLHVGIGTFRPVKTDRLEDHVMHLEWCQLTESAVQQLRATRKQEGRIVAVGTTSVRTLETASQSGELAEWEGTTDLFIRPPHQFQSVDALITNFHLPRSTLLVLVQTFAGDELIKEAYQEAIEEEYRFFSYGDAMLIL